MGRLAREGKTNLLNQTYSKKYVVKNINDYYTDIKFNFDENDSNATNLLFYDFEVFKEDWLVVIIDYNTKDKTIIVNNGEQLKNIYEKHKNDIWIGYNSRNYDSTIFKAILMDMNPKHVNDKLIVEGLKAFQINRNFYKIPFISYDTMITKGESLKQLEGMMGHMIKESDVDFNINRKLTEDEIDDTIYYCTHDVMETIEVFSNTKSNFNAILGMIELFDLPVAYINKTKAQLTAIVLGAERLEHSSNPEDYEFVDCIKLDKYKWIQDWYDINRPDTMINDKGKEVKKKLECNIYGINHTFGVGGVHSAISKYHTNNSDDSIIIHQDIASYYPNMMVNHNLLSRAVKEPKKFKEMLETRLRYKAEKNPLQAPLKIAINSCYGILNDKYNNMYDPKRSREVTINCQLLLIDLVEKIEEALGNDCIYIQGNTDGLIFKLKDEETYNKLKEISAEWEDRTGFRFEYDEIDEIWQSNVNNYIFKFSSGGLELKGAVVQRSSPLKNDMSIINDAIVKYFVEGTPVEDTINNCNELIKFQKISKIGSTYDYVMHGDETMNLKVLRTFATTKDLPGVFKVKKNVTDKDGNIKDSIQKIADTAEHCVIILDNIVDRKCPDWLDKQYYIDIANKKIKNFVKM